MTALNPDIHHRRSVRLRDYDYVHAGVYYVTINTHQRECFFGEAANGDMQLNDMGIIARACWEEIDQYFKNIILDAFVIMPNHVHGVLVNVGAQHTVPLQSHQPTPGSLGVIIRSYKSAVTKHINQRRGTPGASIWQRSYYEHIIRDESELRQIRAYIKQNPARWAEDEYHPDYASKPLRANHSSPLQALKKQGTRTSAFGSPGRISHDAAAFYAGRLYEGLANEEKVEYVENPVPPEALDQILRKSSERMEELPDHCVHLMVTSPPYNVGKEYDQDLTLEEYRAFLKRVWAEVQRVLVPGGRACINIANLGRKPYIPLSAFIAQDMLDLGFLPRGEIIWNKAASGSPSTAWGSWQSAKNPILRDIHEYILVFSQESFSRQDMGRRSTISRDQFLDWTKSVWTFAAEPATKVGHPAPFPVELPYRLIQLYTFEGEVVLDPFAGSGQAAIAALKAGRRYVGYEIDEEYAALARKRIGDFIATLDQTELIELEKNGQR